MALERAASLLGSCIILAICLFISHKLFPSGLAMLSEEFLKVLAALTVARDGNSVAGAE